MPDYLTQLDTKLFYLINMNLQNGILDTIMPYLTKVRHWRLFIFLAWLALMLWGGRKGRTLALLLIPAIAVIDIGLDRILKPFIERIRPCHAYSDVHLLIGCPSSSSFPSNHSANLFTAATLFATYYGKKISLACFVLAATVGFSRVYVGVHYPFDVVGGAMFGVAWGTVFMSFWHFLGIRERRSL
jgi:undecaprenyl-diphosphatase